MNQISAQAKPIPRGISATSVKCGVFVNKDSKIN